MSSPGSLLFPQPPNTGPIGNNPSPKPKGKRKLMGWVQGQAQHSLLKDNLSFCSPPAPHSNSSSNNAPHPQEWPLLTHTLRKMGTSGSLSQMPHNSLLTPFSETLLKPRGAQSGT